MSGKPYLGLAAFVIIGFPCVASAELAGTVAIEARLFTESPRDPEQHESHESLALEPEYHREWNDGRQGFNIKPFARFDAGDPERTHADLREFLWHRATNDWEVRAGIGKVFWGVTEAQHLVDIVNQSDLIEDIDGEEKLGQPMINISRITDFGTWQLFVLPYFRERTFPGEEGRLRTHPPVDISGAQYESSERERHVDWAARWSHYFGEWDVGLSHFAGTARDPRLLPSVDSHGELSLIPYYDLIEHTGLDLQLTHGAWLWKLEAIHRIGQGRAFNAFTGGLEYTVTGFGGSRADLGYLAEYLHDDRGDRAGTPFEDDLFIGARLAFNDTASTELLVGAILDNDGSTLYSVEGSRRATQHIMMRVDARAFSVAPENPLASFENDDYIQIGLVYYF